MRVAGTRGKRRVVSLLLVLLLAHLLLLLLLLLLLRRDSPPTAPSAAATAAAAAASASGDAAHSTLPHTRIQGSPTIEGSPCVGVGGGRKWAWQPVYTVVIDAGATATRAHVFSFLRCCLDNTFMLQNEDYFHQDDSILHYVNASSQMRFLLVPLLRRARSVVPPEYLPHTPLLLRATPSLRLLPRPDATTLIHTARRIVTSSGFLVRRGHVTIMAGHDEAADLWLAANFLTGRLYKNESSPLATADLGGGTLQITVPLSGPPDHIKKAILERRKEKVENDNQKRKEDKAKGHGERHHNFGSAGKVDNNNNSSNQRTREYSASENQYPSDRTNLGGMNSTGGNNSGRRVGVSVNRRLKNNLNNNSSHGVIRGRHHQRNDSVIIAGDNVTGVNEESEGDKPFQFAASNVPKASSGSNTVSGGILTTIRPTEEPPEDESVVYVTAASPAFRTTKRHREKHRGIQSTLDTSSPSAATSSSSFGHEVTTSIPLSFYNRSSSARRTGNNRRGNRRKDVDSDDKIYLRETKNDMSSSQDEINSHVPSSSEAKKNNIRINQGEKEGPNRHTSPGRINYPKGETGGEIMRSSMETQRRGYRGKETRPGESPVKGRRDPGSKRSQRGNNNEGDNPVREREGSSPAKQNSDSIASRNPGEKDNSSRSPLSLTDGDAIVSNNKKAVNSSSRNQRRRERQRNQKKPTRRKQGRPHSRKSPRRENERERKTGSHQEHYPSTIRQTPVTPGDRQQTVSSRISNRDDVELGPLPDPLNVGRGSTGDNRGSKELSFPISSGKILNSTEEGETDVDGHLNQSSKKLAGNNYTMESSNGSYGFNLNISKFPSRTTKEPNHQGNHSGRKNGKSKRVKTSSSKILSPAFKTSREHQESRLIVEGKEMGVIAEEEEDQEGREEEEEEVEREEEREEVENADNISSMKESDHMGVFIGQNQNGVGSEEAHQNNSVVNSVDDQDDISSEISVGISDKNSDDSMTWKRQQAGSRKRHESVAKERNFIAHAEQEQNKGQDLEREQSNLRPVKSPTVSVRTIPLNGSQNSEDKNSRNIHSDYEERSSQDLPHASSTETIRPENNKQLVAKPSIVRTLVGAHNNTSLFSSTTTGNVTPTSTITSKNQSRSITRGVKRRPSKSPLQIEEGREGVATFRQNTPPSKTEEDRRGGNLAGIQRPHRTTKTSRRRHHRHRRRHRHHRHRHSRQKMIGEATKASRRRKRNVLHGPHGFSLSIMDRKPTGRRRRDKNYRGIIRNIGQHFLLSKDLRRTHSSSYFSLLNKWIRHIRSQATDEIPNYKRFLMKGKESSFKFGECRGFSGSKCFQDLHKKDRKNIRTKRNTNTENRDHNRRKVTTDKPITLKMHSSKNTHQKPEGNSSATASDNRKCIQTENEGKNNVTGNARNKRRSHKNPGGVTLISKGDQNLQRPNIREMPEDQRPRRELKNLYDAPNITFRCSPSHKYWLFASSVAMGIYPVRVKVLQSGDIIRIPTEGKPSLTTPTPPAVGAPRHRSDIPPEQEYPELGTGYDVPDISETDEHEPGGAAPIPSPPPSALPTWPTLPSASPSTPPVRITSEWMEETLSKVKAVVDSVLKAIGSREGHREAMNDGQITRIDVDGNPVAGAPSQRGPPSKGHGRKLGRRPSRRRNGTLIVRERGSGSYSDSKKYIESNESDDSEITVTQNSEVSENQDKTLDNRLDLVNMDTLSHSRKSYKSIVTAVPRRRLTSKNVPVDISSSQNVSESDLSSKGARVPNTNSLPVTLDSSNNSTYVNSDQNVIESELSNASDNSNSVASNVNTKDSLTVENTSETNNSDVSSGASPSKQTLSSVTDLLFTVPNERVIKPAENSEVKSEIKSTEKLVRTALEDLLFRVPSAGSRQTEDGVPEEESYQNASSADTGTETQLHELNGSSATISSSSKDEHSKHSLPEETNHAPSEPTDEADSPVRPVQESTANGHEPSPRTDQLWTESSTQRDDLILRTACLPIGSIGRFKVQEVTYLVTGLGSGPGGEDCWREVTSVVKAHIKLPPMTHTTLVATTAFYFVAASANLIEPDMAYGFVRVEQFRLAANIMCQKSAEHLPDPLACIDYMYIAALLSHGLQLPDHTEILVCEKIQGFRVGWALGAALNYLQKH